MNFLACWINEKKMIIYQIKLNPAFFKGDLGRHFQFDPMAILKKMFQTPDLLYQNSTS